MKGADSFLTVYWLHNRNVAQTTSQHANENLNAGAQSIEDMQRNGKHFKIVTINAR